VDDETILAELSVDAHAYAPRLFALYGVYHPRPSDHGYPGFLGWGMEFDLPRKAILWMPDGTTWHSESASSLYERLGGLGKVRLVWLDGEPQSPFTNGYHVN
jgi:hypothetical protein